MNKQEIRDRLKKIKLNISLEEREQSSFEVMKRVETLSQFKDSEKVLLYNALPDELPTQCMLDSWSITKELYLPVVVGDELVIRRYNPASMKIGAFGIGEPDGDEIALDEIDMIIVPGVAFDYEHNRLGRGKGYYDRLLVNSKAFIVGVGYSLQLLDSIPAEKHDVKMNCIITENTIL